MADFETIADRIGLPNHMRINQIDPKDPTGTPAKTYTVLVNPQSYSTDFKACYVNDTTIGATETDLHFNKAKEQSMSVDLLFDSTGSLGKIPLIGNQSALEQIEEFLAVAYVEPNVKKEHPETKFMQLIWGPMEFLGVLTSVSINYSHFDATGTPIRATAKCKFSGGNVTFDRPEKIKLPPFIEKLLPKKKVDYAKQKHAINAVIKYSSYLPVVATQPETAMPKSLRIASEVAKLII